MGRPRQYGSDAERQRAFRQRLQTEWPRVNGAALERLHQRLDELQQAVWAAEDAGDESGRACSAASVETVLERVIQHFHERARQSQQIKQGDKQGS
jgi:hypothetical protein